MKKFLSLTVLLAGLSASAQVTDLYNTDIKWAASPVLHSMPAQFADADAVYLLDERIFELTVENKLPLQYNRYHRLIKVNDDKGIESFNKIYLPMYANSEINDIRARVITSAGKVINVPGDKIKESVEEGKRYKLFAMEGIDKGSEVEYSYTMKKNISTFGSELFQSRDIPYLVAKVSVVSPKYLKFDAKGFNGFKVLPDSVFGERRVITGYSENIAGLDEEKYGLRDRYLQRFDFKLSYNLSNNADAKLYTWNEFARNAYSNLTTYSDKEKKALVKFINNAKVPEGANEETTIRILEDYMKRNVVTDDKLEGDDAGNIEVIIKTGNATDFGISRLFIGILETRGIMYRIVFPSLRDGIPLDEDMANWNRADEILVYFPASGKFVQPSGIVMRYPFIEAYWAGTTGLFLKGTSIGDVKTATAKFDTIPILSFEESAHDMEENVKIDDSGDSLLIESKQIMRGYAAVSYRPLWTYLAADKQEEAIKDIIKNVAPSDNIKNIKTENTALTDAWDNKPLIISATIHTAELLERAGDKILFKVGELIGTQEQMYQEKKRQLPAEVQYPHRLYRIIKFEIPKDYTIKNLDDILMDTHYKRDELVYMGFVSTYKVTGNILEIEIMETYRDIKYPLKDFNNFEKVINASADFNKVVLVLEKK